MTQQTSDDQVIGRPAYATAASVAAIESSIASVSSDIATLNEESWTNLVLGSDFSTTSDSDTNVTGLSFTPVANTTYLIEAYCLLRTETAIVGPRLGMSTPSGCDGAYNIMVPNSNTAMAFQAQGAMGDAPANAASLGVPLTTASYLGTINAVIVTGSSPSGDVQVTLASAVAGTSVTIRTGSFLRYRTIS